MVGQCVQQQQICFPFHSSIKVTEDADKIILTAGTNKAVIHAKPFTIEFFRNDILFVTANAKGLLRYEHLRRRRAQEYTYFSLFSFILHAPSWFGYDVSIWENVFYSRANPENPENQENPDIEARAANAADDGEVRLNDEADDQPGAWEEEFKSHHDSKPNGPEAVALDFTFPQAQVLFGIPEHADAFALVGAHFDLFG